MANVQKGHHGGKSLLAKITTVAVMIEGRHMLVGIDLGHKHLVAPFAGNGSDRIHDAVLVPTQEYGSIGDGIEE